MEMRKRKTGRRIPETVGTTTKEALTRLDALHKDVPIALKLKAIDLCFSERMFDSQIAEELQVSRQTVTNWLNETIGPAYVEMSKQAMDRAVRIINGLSKVVFSFEDVYEESTRENYVRKQDKNGLRRTPVMNRWKQGRKEFRSLMLRAGIDLACFIGEDGKFHFNEDGKTIAIDILKNRTNRKDLEQQNTSYDVYQAIRSNYFPYKFSKHYNWMLDMACSNLRDIKDAFPDQEYPDETDVRNEFWRNTCERNGGFDAFPGMSCLGEIPQYVSECWFFIHEDIVRMDSRIKETFSGSEN